ncbi:hypothetical protein Vretimale_7819 [Volvox reticuliferus]|nr:hypothetical protein Vretimale_7819 [Volvox reticuliferus]
MGGHGGLNILPQKRWNVYNRENRLKVAQDEAKAEKQEEEARKRHGEAEREHRRQLLLRRASGGDGSRGEVLGGGELPAARLEHINFWKEEEAKLQHPENQKQQQDELKRRGNPDFYTSDAKFDERFALGYGLLAEKPWYAQAQKPEDCADRGAGATAGMPAVSAAHPGPRSLAQSGATAAGQARQALNTQQQLLLKRVEQPEGLQRRGGRSRRDRRRDDSTDRSGASTSTSSSSESSKDTDNSTSSSEDSSSHDSSNSSSSTSSDSDSSGRRSQRRKRRWSSTSPSRERHSHRGSKRRRTRSRRSKSFSDDSSHGRGASNKRKHRHSERSKSRSKSGSRRDVKSKSKRDSDKLLLSNAVAVGASKSIEQLRAERLQREKEERVKQHGLLASTAVWPDGPPSKSYNSAYGFAAGMKRRRD